MHEQPALHMARCWVYPCYTLRLPNVGPYFTIYNFQLRGSTHAVESAVVDDVPHSEHDKKVCTKVEQQVASQHTYCGSALTVNTGKLPQ